MTTAGVPVVIFSAWAVVGPGGRSVVLDISTVKGGKVADLFNGVFWGIGPKKYIYRKLSLKHPLNSFCSLRYQKAGHLHEVVLFLLPESISHLPSVILKWRETDLCFKQHQGLSIIPPSPPPKKNLPTVIEGIYIIIIHYLTYLWLQLVCLSLYFLPERLLDQVGGRWCWIFPQLEVVKLRIGLTESFEELDLKIIFIGS